MKYIFLLLLLVACTQQQEPRLVVKKVNVNDNEYVEWYNKSLISSYGPDMIEYVDSLGARTLIYKSHYVSDVTYDSGMIQITWWKKGGVTGPENINGHPIKIDSGGCHFMSSTARRTHGENWRENICQENLILIQFERKHPHQYDTLK